MDATRSEARVIKVGGVNENLLTMHSTSLTICTTPPNHRIVDFNEIPSTILAKFGGHLLLNSPLQMAMLLGQPDVWVDSLQSILALLGDIQRCSPSSRSLRRKCIDEELVYFINLGRQ